LVDQRKQAKVQWLQDPSVVNEDNLRNVRREDSRNFRNKKRECLKDKITETELNSKNKTSETCIGAYLNLRRVTNLKLTW
jgi:ribonuclease HII